MKIEPFKTWLVCHLDARGDGPVHRHNKYGSNPDWIGEINNLDGKKWFEMYGDNRTLSKAELKQLLDWCSE